MSLLIPGKNWIRLSLIWKPWEDRIEELHKKGLTIEAIRQQVFGEESPSAQRTQQQFSSENMVKSFLRRNVGD